MSKRWLRFTLSISLLFLLALCLLILQGPDRALYDALAAIPDQPERETPVTLVAIDDLSFRELGRRWPWPRQWLAEAVDELARLGAIGIGLDIILSDPGFTEAEDLALGTSLEAFPDTVLIAKFTATPQGPVLEEAQPKLMEHASSGYGNLIYDRDGTLRRYAFIEQTRQGFLFPSFAYALFDILRAKAVAAASPARSMPAERPAMTDPFLDFHDPSTPAPPKQTNIPGQRLLDLSILGRNGLPTYSFSSLLAGQIPEEAIRNRIVLIGATYPESKDQVPVPGAKDTPLYGVEIHAHALVGLIHQSFRREASLAARLLILLVAVLLHGFLVAFLPFSLALSAAGLSMVLGLGATMFSWFRFGFFLPPAVWLGCGLLSIP